MAKRKMTTARRKGKKLPVETLTDEDVRSLIEVCSNRAPTGVRNRALIVVMYRAGLRLAEALELNPKDFDLDLGTIRVLHGKGEVAVEDALDVADLEVGAQILDHLIRVQHIGADLTPPARLGLIPPDGLDLCKLFLSRHLGKAGRQQLHRSRPVLDLGPLGLT